MSFESRQNRVTCGSKRGHHLKNLVGVTSWDVVTSNRGSGGRYESQHIIRIHKLKWKPDYSLGSIYPGIGLFKHGFIYFSFERTLQICKVKGSQKSCLPVSSEWPFWVFQVTFSQVKWPPFGISKGHLEEAGRENAKGLCSLTTGCFRVEKAHMESQNVSYSLPKEIDFRNQLFPPPKKNVYIYI